MSNPGLHPPTGGRMVRRVVAGQAVLVDLSAGDVVADEVAPDIPGTTRCGACSGLHEGLRADAGFDCLTCYRKRRAERAAVTSPPSPPRTLPPAASRILVDRHRDRVEEVHLVEGRVARVRRTADGERYAEPWDEVTKRYGQHEPGLVARTSDSTRLDPHRAAEHGRAWGHCMVCGRLLTASASVTSGIGPKCVVDVYGYDARAEIVAGIEQRSRITAVTS